MLKKDKKGRRYFGCENNPECDFMSWQKPVSKNARNAVATWLKKEIRLHVQMKHVDILKLKQKKGR